jgi:hypothetical protein
LEAEVEATSLSHHLEVAEGSEQAASMEQPVVAAEVPEVSTAEAVAAAEARVVSKVDSPED